MRDNVTDFTLRNGLRIIIEEDPNTPIAVCNVLYKVGSRNEEASKTGFAHLFEHFMFEGSEHIPAFDTALQRAGGRSNAFTTADFTNYYDVLPACNIETAMWLEADRMRMLAFSQKELDTQIKVVCEEFKENYITRPYGDVWHLLMDLSYKNHPYRWPVIGKSLDHIKSFTLADTRAFFQQWYRPDNAILSICGGVDAQHVLALAETYFGAIEKPEMEPFRIAQESEQRTSRHKVHRAPVPDNALYITWPMPHRMHSDYYAWDLLSDLLAGDNSSYLHKTLVKKQGVFTSVNSYITGSIDNGLLVFQGWLAENTSADDASEALFSALSAYTVSNEELEKVKNNVRFDNERDKQTLKNRALIKAYYEMLGDWRYEYSEDESYRKVQTADVQRLLATLLPPHPHNRLDYWQENKSA